jgi:histone-lysine N-methyltransferase SETD2
MGNITLDFQLMHAYFLFCWNFCSVINEAICEERLWTMKEKGDHNFYMCEIGKNFIIDATFKGNTSRFVNHSCHPNCILEKW